MHNSIEALRAFLLVPPVAKFTDDFRTLAREKADKVSGGLRCVVACIC